MIPIVFKLLCSVRRKMCTFVTEHLLNLRKSQSFFFYALLGCCWVITTERKASQLAIIPVVFVCMHKPAYPKQDCMYSGLRLRQSLTDYTQATLRRPLEVNIKKKRRKKNICQAKMLKCSPAQQCVWGAKNRMPII